MTINEISGRVVALKEEYRMNSIDPQRLGDIMLNILQYINSSQVRMQSPAIHKRYSSVSAMQLDAKPVSDLTGLDMKVGQLVCIVPASSSEPTAGDVYRYDGPSGNTSAWTYVGKIGGIPADQELDEASINPVANAPVARKLAQFDQEWSEVKGKIEDAVLEVVVQAQPHIHKVIVEGGAAILEPDKLYMFGEVAQIALDFAPVENEDFVAQYAFQFKCPADAVTTLTMPEVKFPVESNNSLKIVEGRTYQITIVNGLAVATSWEE